MKAKKKLPAKKNSKRPTRRNSAVEEASEGFHGRPVEETYEVETSIRVHSQLAELGDLVALEVQAIGGGMVKIEDFGGAVLCMNPERTQLYIEGGDQAVALEDFGIDSDAAHDSEVLGKVKRIRYATVKHHLGDQGGDAIYKHTFGEEGGDLPHLIYDNLNGLLSLSGGSYTIPNEGIRD